ncbi:MAG: hypothetical protein IIC82_08995, partial [Chloroflexi bacterium]|nr:hypothetical protein [Chloroflexota bacterium]
MSKRFPIRITKSGDNNQETYRFSVLDPETKDLLFERVVDTEDLDAMKQTALALRQALPDFADDEREAMAKLLDALIKAQQKAGTRPDAPPSKTQATILVELAGDMTFFHDPDSVPYATIAVKGHKENHLIKSKAFGRHLRRLFYEQEDRAPSSQAFQDALGVLEGKAVFDGEQHELHLRMAEHDGNYYIDLGDPEWQVVRISPGGWEVVATAPVKFRRPGRGMLALPRPERGGNINTLRRFVNFSNDAEGDKDWALLLAWLVATLKPTGPYPIYIANGEHGSAKSTVARVLKALVDPSKLSTRSQPRNEQDLMIAANGNWIISLDNISRLPQWLSDALCRLSTGSGFGTRELYTNEGEAIFEGQRPIIINGITDVAASGDILDRAIGKTFEQISEDARMTEAEFWAAFNAEKPGIFGALLDAVAVGLQRAESVRVSKLPRMADFALWNIAVEPGLGLADGAFMSAYAGNRKEINEVAL